MSKVVPISMSKETSDKIAKWAIKFGVTTEYIEGIYAKNFMKINDEKRARALTMGNLEEEFGSIISNAATFYVYLLSDSGPVDIFDLMRQKSLNMYNDPDRSAEAQSKQMISPDGIPLDYRKQVFGKLNEGFGLPLTGSLFSRSFIGVVSETEDFTKAFISEMIAKDEFAKTLNDVVPRHFYKFRGNQNKKVPTRITISKTTKFIPFQPKVTVGEIAAKVPMVYEIENLEDVYREQFAGKKNTAFLAPVRGTVIHMSLEAFKGARNFIIYDEDSEQKLRCRISDKIPIEFKASDEVLTFNRLYADRSGKIGAETKAYMVI